MLKKYFSKRNTTILFIFLSMLIFNILTPYICDDYQFMYNYETTKRITNIFEIFRELHLMYFNWGGRVLAHFFAYLFLMLPKWIFNIVNSIVYISIVYLIYLIGRRDKKDNYNYLIFIHMLLFLLLPVYGQIFLWLDGSCNYAFTLCIQLFFLYKITNIKSIKKTSYFIYLIFGILAGMCNENSSLSIIVFLILYIISDFKNIKLKIVSLIGLIMGYLFLFFAPGNFVRMKTASSTSMFYNFFPKLLFLIKIFSLIILMYTIIQIIIYVKYKKEFKLSFIMFLSSGVAAFSMIASPELSFRAFTISIVYIIITFVILMFNVPKKIIKILSIILVIVFTISYINTCFKFYDLVNFYNKRDKLIMDAVSRGEESIEIAVFEKETDNNNCKIPVNCGGNPALFLTDEKIHHCFDLYYGIKTYEKN